MRSLEVRVRLALARIANVINEQDRDTASPAMLDVMCEAENVGHCDAMNGIRVPPALFQDEPNLMVFWEQGQAIHWEGFENEPC